jgi:hypothetical protein
VTTLELLVVDSMVVVESRDERTVEGVNIDAGKEKVFDV